MKKNVFSLLLSLTMLVLLSACGEKEPPPADSGTDSLLGGLLAIVLLVYALFAAMDLGRWLDSPFARRLLPLRSPLALLLPRLACAAISRKLLACVPVCLASRAFVGALYASVP